MLHLFVCQTSFKTQPFDGTSSRFGNVNEGQNAFVSTAVLLLMHRREAGYLMERSRQREEYSHRQRQQDVELTRARPDPPTFTGYLRRAVALRLPPHPGVGKSPPHLDVRKIDARFLSPERCRHADCRIRTIKKNKKNRGF